MPEAMITYFGLPAKVACDGCCAKAWGISNRPRLQLTDDEDDYAFLPDQDLGTAPEDPGTYEFDHAKPLDASEFPNKWCVRECERCVMSEPDKWPEPLALRDFGVLQYNIPRDEAKGGA